MTSRRHGRANILRRIEELEARSIDGSSLVPHSPEWLAFWMKRYELLGTDQQPRVRMTLEAAWAVMNAISDDDVDEALQLAEGNVL